MRAATQAPPQARPQAGGTEVPQARFDDLYSAAYAIIDDAKTDHDLVKLYKGSHGSPQPHPVVTEFGEHFFRTQQGLIAYCCSAINPRRRPVPADLEAFDNQCLPRVPVRAVFDLLAEELWRPGESASDLLAYVTSRRHSLGAYRGGSSGYDDEARAFAAAHFRSTGLAVSPDEVLVFCGGAKGAFMAFCAAIMCRRIHDDLQARGGFMLAPAGYYQSLRLIPPVFGADIHLTRDLTGDTVRAWLAATAGQPRRCVYVPLVNNFDGQVLTIDRARSIAHAILAHNTATPDDPVYVLADDVYVGSYLTGDAVGVPIGSVTGADLGEPELGQMSDWTLSVVTPSKTFALPTSRVAFATTTHPGLREAIAHYRTVFSHGRVPQVCELTAVAAMCLTPQAWVDSWNARYRTRLDEFTRAVAAINAELGFAAFGMREPQGGWYLPLRVSRALIPTASSGVDALAVLLHYSGAQRGSGIATLPGELFGCRDTRDGFMLRGTLATGGWEARLFAERLRDAAGRLTGPGGPELAERAMKRARAVADIDTILASCRF